MNTVIRWVYGIVWLMLGIPSLLFSSFQGAATLGYEAKPEDEINANFLSGYETFIDEATAAQWSVGYAKNELTPEDVLTERYFLGGYLRFPAQEATGVIDELWVRAVVLDDNSGRGAVAFAWIDTVGFMNNDVKAIREKLADITGDGKLVSINVGSTHTHSAIDTQGLWGNLPDTGRHDGYMNAVIEKTADAIRTAYETRSEGELYYSSKECPSYFSDGRAPRSFDKNIHLLRFVPNDSSKREVYISNFGAHPVNVDWRITQLSADFPYYVEKNVTEKCDADFIYIQGAIGGAIHANTRVGVTDSNLTEFERMVHYGAEVADVLAELAEAGERVEPVLNVAHSQVELELDNFVFRLAEKLGVCNVKAYIQDGEVMVTTEIGYAEIGDNIKILMMPGEILPEIVYGGFLSAEDAYNGTEYPYPALKESFSEDDNVLTFGLCNDALGYIVPDNDYCSTLIGAPDGHSHESISVGSKAASAISKAFGELISVYQ